MNSKGLADETTDHNCTASVVGYYDQVSVIFTSVSVATHGILIRKLLKFLVVSGLRLSISAELAHDKKYL